jgi:hypothetical protein
MGNWPEPSMVDTGKLHLTTYEYGRLPLPPRSCCTAF